MKPSTLDPAVIEFIKDYSAEYGWMPTRREIAGSLGCRPAAVQNAFERLERAGRIVVQAGGARTYRLVDEGEPMVPRVEEM